MVGEIDDEVSDDERLRLDIDLFCFNEDKMYNDLEEIERT